MSKVLAIGDVHTKHWMVDRAAERLPEYDQIVFVGDYADAEHTGPEDSIITWNKLKELQQRSLGKVAVLSGNHDFGYVFDVGAKWSGYNPRTDMLLHDEHPETAKWLRHLPIHIEIDGVTYSHAGLTSNWSGTRYWDDKGPLWVRPGEGIEYVPKKQVFGHNPSETCWEVEPGVWCIDTFSVNGKGEPIGDRSVLEIIDGERFKRTQL